VNGYVGAWIEAVCPRCGWPGRDGEAGVSEVVDTFGDAPGHVLVECRNCEHEFEVTL
jgi:uncharacterized Zn finger protein